MIKRGDILHCIKIDLPRELKTLEIHTFADLHIGDRTTDLKMIQERINYVKQTPNAYCILNGDLMNNATKTSVSDSYAEEIPPMEQIQKCVDMFEPVKDKILAVTTGNHERRTYNKEGIDLMEVAARQMGLYDRFSKSGVLIFVRFGEQSRGHKETNGSGNVRKMCYTIYTNHGSGGGRKEGAKAIRLADMASIVDADIYIHSHTHLPMVMKQAFFRTDIPNSTCRCVDKLFVNTAATLNYGGYGEVYELKPASKDTPVIYLNGTKKRNDSEVIKMDNVIKPVHYADKNIEVIDYIKDTLTDTQYTGYCLGNVIKYISRYQKKNGVEDLQKARVYLNWLIEVEQKMDEH